MNNISSDKVSKSAMALLSAGFFIIAGRVLAAGGLDNARSGLNNVASSAKLGKRDVPVMVANIIEYVLGFL
ncbi:MAG: hypothetical protein NUV82_03690, partial [Candidatus Komeilibacteria bacterium]|nr:hypothetical protein [Candidatus Komeilibacteria bacterium]